MKCLDSDGMTPTPNSIKTGLLFKKLFKWQNRSVTLPVFLTLGVQHRAGVKRSEAATYSATRSRLGATATRV